MTHSVSPPAVGLAPGGCMYMHEIPN